MLHLQWPTTLMLKLLVNFDWSLVGVLGLMKNRNNPKADGIQTCIQHRAHWRSH
jgi:hypothetical protein